MSKNPSALGFRMPAEWEPHAATWIAWPHQRDDWPGKFDAIPWVYAEIVRQLHQSENVFILVNDLRAEQKVRQVLARVFSPSPLMGEGGGASPPPQGGREPYAPLDETRIHFVPIRTDRCWTRDFCPLFVSGPNGEVAVTDWQFNGWAKYPNWKRDNAVPKRICKTFNFRRWEVKHEGKPVVLEGGSIDVNGQGLMLTTEECLLSPVQQRNPGLERGDLERLFADYLGVRKVLWLGRGIAGDDTHGHVDDLARFVNPNTVVTVVEDDPADINYEPLQDNLHRLRSMTDLNGQPLNIVPLPMPAPVIFDGQCLPASYANFYIANDRVLVPTFNAPQDRKALSILADLFPTRTVVGIHAVDLVWGLGTLHCLTQQQPSSGQ